METETRPTRKHIKNAKYALLLFLAIYVPTLLEVVRTGSINEIGQTVSAAKIASSVSVLFFVALTLFKIVPKQSGDQKIEWYFSPITWITALFVILLGLGMIT